MRFYWVRDRIWKNHFHILWEEEKKKYVVLCQKTPPNMAPQNYETKILETNNKRHIKLKKGRNGTGRGWSGTTNPRVTHKMDNPPKGIRNIIPRKPDNPIKGIQNLAPSRIWSHCPRGLTIQTQISINLPNQPLISTCQWNISRLPNTSSTIYPLRHRFLIRFHSTWPAIRKVGVILCQLATPFVSIIILFMHTEFPPISFW